ncbi:MAG: alpha-L-fucosidase, partial [Flavisolibacter sp.]
MKFLFCFLLSITVAGSISAQPYEPTAENLAARQAFKNDRFGLYIHWGPFSIPGAGEWVLN